MKALLAAVAAFSLAGCGLMKPAPLTASVEVPVACVTKKPTRPSFITEQELVGLSAYQVPIALDLHRIMAQAYIAELEAVVEGCSRIPAR